MAGLAADGSGRIGPSLADFPWCIPGYCENVTMTHRSSVVTVPFRHNSWRIFHQLLLFALLANVLWAANPSITLQVSSETAPPGGYAQFKISLTSPALVSSAGLAMKLDPTIFGPVASVAAF